MAMDSLWNYGWRWLVPSSLPVVQVMDITHTRVPSVFRSHTPLYHLLTTLSCLPVLRDIFSHSLYRDLLRYINSSVHFTRGTSHSDMRGAWSLTALAVSSVAAQELPDWQNENTIDWRTFGQWQPPTSVEHAPAKSIPPTAPQNTQKAPKGYPSRPPKWTPTQHAVAKQVVQETPVVWGSESPSVTVVFAEATNTIYTTVDITVTS